MRAIRVRGQCDVHPIVDQEEHVGRGRPRCQLSAQCEERWYREALLSQLDRAGGTGKRGRRHC